MPVSCPKYGKFYNAYFPSIISLYTHSIIICGWLLFLILSGISLISLILEPFILAWAPQNLFKLRCFQILVESGSFWHILTFKINLSFWYWVSGGSPHSYNAFILTSGLSHWLFKYIYVFLFYSPWSREGKMNSDNITRLFLICHSHGMKK